MKTLLMAALLGAWAVAAVQDTNNPKPFDEDHKASIRGIAPGMTAQQVLELLGRKADAAKDDKDELILSWKLENGNLLHVRFRHDNFVSAVAEQFKIPRPANDFLLQPLGEARAGSQMAMPGQVLEGTDPRLHREYKVTQTVDREQVIWMRQEKAPLGYTINIGFISVPKRKAGQLYDSQVESKFVSVDRNDLKKFDQAMRAGK